MVKWGTNLKISLLAAGGTFLFNLATWSLSSAVVLGLIHFFFSLVFFTMWDVNVSGGFNLPKLSFPKGRTMRILIESYEECPSGVFLYTLCSNWWWPWRKKKRVFFQQKRKDKQKNWWFDENGEHVDEPERLTNLLEMYRAQRALLDQLTEEVSNWRYDEKTGREVFTLHDVSGDKIKAIK